MTEHLTEPEIELYRQRAGEETARHKTAAHLAICEHCVNRVYDTAHAVLAIDGVKEAFLSSVAEEPFHLSPSELRAYAAGRAAEADRIICESHLEICEPCSEQLRAQSASQSSARLRVAEPTIERLAWLRSGWWTTKPVRVAAAIALIGLLALGALLIKRRSSAPAPARLAGNGSQETPGGSLPDGPAKNDHSTNNPPVVPDSSPQSIVVRLKDNGQEIGLDQQGRLAGLEQLDESTQRTVKDALAGEPLARPRLLDELSSPQIRLMGEQSNEKTLQLTSPLGRVITEVRPRLQWTRLAGANSYVASVYDSKFNLVGRSSPISQTLWTVAEPLQRGQSYFWEVAATKDGKEVVVPVAPAPRAQFRILEADKLNALQNLKRQKPVSHLALGLTYARLGLVKEAEGEFRSLLNENPDSAVAKKLLRTVQGWNK